ncbi:ribosome-associated heat shock protein Hsp15 [Neiella marina]|uniref:Heat shock protein 15 n=1 Tax=Neiella holothuriorum TaxID=2870530 RepID=A0ABS7EFX6_9GAMM|nr:ribosome-associated heat shock protein Hsp15 [Neiella holothuriorum]MBW8191254.1 ribosome-associated heat shock protein Hsp15 [Neiella holothuriorum]
MSCSSNIRLDKWLWAARFYKTRSIAQQMVQGGKVRYNGQRCKPSKTIEVGATVRISQGFVDQTVVIQELSGTRRSAPEAQRLYQETAESKQQREQLQQQRKLAFDSKTAPPTKPDKKQRRELLQLKSRQRES